MAMARRAFCAWVLRNAVVAWALAGGLLLAALTLRGSPVSRNCPHGNLQTRLAPKAQQPPWQAALDCPIYILDVSAEVAPAIGIPKCDINDPQVWPLARPGKLPWELQRMETIPHMHYMYASQYWLNQALRNATGVLTDNIDKACLVWVDTYCYNQWYVSWRAVKNRPHIQKLYPSPAGLDVEQLLTQAVDHILDSPRFKKRQGRDYVFHTPLTNPGKAYKRMCTDMLYSHTLVVEHPLSCINKGRPKVSLRETQILPYSAVANAGDLSAPIVGSLRPTFMYMQANCGTAQCGMLMRLTIAEALAGSPADVQVKCANRPVRQPKPHAQVQLEMRRSVLCLLVPGDNVSSGRLTEAILAGCIPVFIGDPWHELPFNHGEVEWPNIAVFIKVQSPGWTNATTCAAPLKQWNQKADVTYATATVASLDAAFAYLRALPKEAIERRQAALERERTKFMYAAPPGRDSSALSDIVFTNLLGYGRRLLETPM